MKFKYKAAVFMVSAFLCLGLVAFAATQFNGIATSQVTITGTPQNIAFTGGFLTTSSGSVPGTVGSASSITFPSIQIGEGGSYSITVSVANSGGTAGTATATAACSGSCVVGSTLNLTTGPASQNVPANGGSASWTFTYSASTTTTGADSITVSVSA